jgi:thioredoxin reductase
VTNLRMREVIIVGGGLAALSATIYLERSRRDTLLCRPLDNRFIESPVNPGIRL